MDAAVEVALVLLYVAYEANTPSAGNWAAIAVLFLFQQVAVPGRVFLRVALIGAERHFYLATVPTAAAVPRPEVAPEAPVCTTS